MNRDQLAAQFAQATLTGRTLPDQGLERQHIAKQAYGMADALIAEGNDTPERLKALRCQEAEAAYWRFLRDNAADYGVDFAALQHGLRRAMVSRPA